MKDTHNVNDARIIVIAACAFVLAGCTKPRESAGPVQPAAAAIEPAAEPNAPDNDIDSSADSLSERWGIKVERTMLSAGGYMVDFRFRVLNAAKARPILDRRIHPYLIDQATGAQFIVPSPPKIGQLRSGKTIREGAVYAILFANPGKYMKCGNKVTVVVGDFQVRDIVIQ